MNEKLIEEAKLYIQKIFKDNSDGHDANHSLRVYKNALQIAKAYPECNMMVVALSSLLHDVDDHKLFDTKDNMNARQFLKSHDIGNDDIELICQIINGVSFSKNKEKHPEIDVLGSLSAIISGDLTNRGCKIDIESGYQLLSHMERLGDLDS